MKRWGVFFILLLLVLPPILAESQRVIIKEKINYERFSVSSINQDKIPSEKIIHDFGNIKSAILTEEEILELKKNPNLEIELEPIKRIFMQDVIYLTNSTEIWKNQLVNTNLTGKGETICIIDTGVNFSHPDLTGKNLTCNRNCSINNCPEDCSISDLNGHGTHVAGIAAANGNLKGIAKEANLISLMVCNEFGNCYDSAIKAGIDWCVNNKNSYNISIISLSLGSENTYSTYCDGLNDPTGITSSINNAVERNISVVVATGNDASLTGISSPACIKNATRVADLYKENYFGQLCWGDNCSGNPTCSDTNPLLDQIVCHANRGSFFTDLLFTYGAIINSTSKNGNYVGYGGTSMATPMAAGMVALLKQYKKLESNKTLTNDEVAEILINSSKKIYDSSTNTNYSKLNSLDIILYSDEQAPEITYMFPENNSLIQPANIEFICNATDNLQFANLTIQLENSTEILFNLTTNENNLEVNYSLNPGEYNWSCIAKDLNSNTVVQANSFEVTPIFSQINNLENNTFTNQSQIEFNCSAQTTQELTNITFSIYNSTSLLNQTTKNISGKENSSIFEYNFTNEEEYFYSCTSLDNESNSYSTQNNSITYDVTPPQINLISPANNLSTQTKTITFTYDPNEINSNCNLSINEELKSSFTQTLSNGNYEWKVFCTDKAGNSNFSESRNLTIYTLTSSGGSGGGSSAKPRIYSITENEIKIGSEKKLKEKDQLNFKVNSKSHKLTVTKIEQGKLNLTIESDPIYLILNLNETRKIDLDNNKIFDLEISIISISPKETKLFLKEINEPVPIKRIFEEPTKDIPISISNESTQEMTGATQKNSNYQKLQTEIMNFLKLTYSNLLKIFQKINFSY